MSITVVGPWVLFAVGVAMLVMAIRLGGIGGRLKELVVFLVMGTLLAGTSVWGLGFLAQYRDFLQTTHLLTDMLSQPGEASYREAIQSVATGQVRPQYQQAILAVALQRPIEGLDHLLSQTAAIAPDRQGKDALSQAGADLEGMRAAARLVASEIETSPATSADVLRELDPASRALVARHLQSLPGDRQRRLNVSPQSLQHLSKIQPRLEPAGH